MNTVYDIAVIGGGMVGMASAWKLSLLYPNLNILLLEKEKSLSAHQTGRNSGVIHSGIYYKPGSYKARNCVEGRRELVAFAKQYKVAHDICGKIIVATHASELPFMEKIFQNGLENGIEDMEKINSEQIQELEPHCRGIAGVRVGCTGIIDFSGVVHTMAELFIAHNPGNQILRGYEVYTTLRSPEGMRILTKKGEFLAQHLVFCGGLQSDRLALNNGVDQHMRILGFRGDYYDLSESGRDKVRNLIYPVPNPQFPFLGVHFTRMIHGGVECGPNAVFTFKREGYGKLDFNIKDTVEAMSFGGTWKFLSRHWKFGLDEYRRAFSKALFLKRLQHLIPDLQAKDLVPGRSGVRAMALDPDGKMVDDFRIEKGINSIHVLNAPSPAATAGLAIGHTIAELAEQHFHLIK